MPIDTKHEDLQSLRIDRSAWDGGDRPTWARRYIVIGIAVVFLLSCRPWPIACLRPTCRKWKLCALLLRAAMLAAVVLSATGYIVAHHKINVNSKVTGRVAWIGVEKGDKVKEGQVLVRLEDQEFRAQYEQAKGAAG